MLSEPALRMRDRARTQALLVASAARLFAELGYHSVSVQDIGDDAGVNKRLVYYYFIDKESLFRAAIEQASDWLSENFAAGSDASLEVVIATALNLLCTERTTARLLEMDVSLHGMTTHVRKDVVYQALRQAAGRAPGTMNQAAIDNIYVATLQVARLDILAERASQRTLTSRRGMAAGFVMQAAMRCE